MPLNIGATEGVVDDLERQELNDLVDHASVVGFSILSQDGEALQADGLSERAVAALSTICDQTHKLGLELGEQTRPSVMLSGAGLEVGALPLVNASAVIVRRNRVGLNRD